MSTETLEKPTRRKLRWYKKLLFLCVPAVVALVALEVVVRVSGKARNVGPSFTCYDAEYGKRVKKDFSCWRYAPEFEMKFTANSRGFRGPEPVGSQENGIVFIGDSFTMGYGVSDGEEYPALVRERLSEELGADQVPVTNMGMGDNGNGRWLKFLEREVTKYSPRLVVLQICGNDFTDNMNEGLYRLDGGEIVEMPIPPKSGMRKLQGAIESVPGLSYSYLLSFVKQAVGELRHRSADAAGPTPPAPSESTDEPVAEQLTPRQQLTHALIGRAVEICRAQDWPVLIIMVELSETRRRGLEQLCEQLSQEIMFMPEKSEQPELYFEVDGHWNTAGHRYVGDLLAERILAHWE